MGTPFLAVPLDNVQEIQLIWWYSRGYRGAQAKK